jgi:uncharacterized protein (TIGR03382 family)
MKGLIAGGALTILIALTVDASAGPKWHDKRTNVEQRMQMNVSDYTCSTGAPASLLVGVAALGLVLRRRR